MKLKELGKVLTANTVHINSPENYEIVKFERISSKDYNCHMRYIDANGKDLFEKYGNREIKEIYGDISFYAVNIDLN